MPGDYDETETDVAVFRPSTRLLVLLYSNVSLRHTPSDRRDLPTAGDYDGDAKRTSRSIVHVTLTILVASSDARSISSSGVRAAICQSRATLTETHRRRRCFRPSISTFISCRVPTTQRSARSDKTQTRARRADLTAAHNRLGSLQTSRGWYYLQSTDLAFRGVAWLRERIIAEADMTAMVNGWAVFRLDGIFYILQSTKFIKG